MAAWVAKEGHEAVIKALVAAKADIHAKDQVREKWEGRGRGCGVVSVFHCCGFYLKHLNRGH